MKSTQKQFDTSGIILFTQYVICLVLSVGVIILVAFTLFTMGVIYITWVSQRFAIIGTAGYEVAFVLGVGLSFAMIYAYDKYSDSILLNSIKC